jgi:hypothetical protein
VASAARIIGRKQIGIDTDPPPDIVVEIDVANESVGKFSIDAAFGVGEIWHVEDGDTVHFLQLAGSEYRAISESASFPGLTPDLPARALAVENVPAAVAFAELILRRRLLLLVFFGLRRPRPVDAQADAVPERLDLALDFVVAA